MVTQYSRYSVAAVTKVVPDRTRSRSANPFWDRVGVTIADPDGCRNRVGCGYVAKLIGYRRLGALRADLHMPSGRNDRRRTAAGFTALHGQAHSYDELRGQTRRVLRLQSNIISISAPSNTTTSPLVGRFRTYAEHGRTQFQQLIEVDRLELGLDPGQVPPPRRKDRGTIRKTLPPRAARRSTEHPRGGEMALCATIMV